jgi:phosphoserine phosphatase RsbX
MSLQVLEMGIAGHASPQETLSGDRHVLCEFPGGVLVGLLDGLGHGPAALDAARLASETLVEHAQESLVSLISRCHERLRPARGVVMSLASFLSGQGLMSWAGVGNVEGILVRGNGNGTPRVEDESLLVRPGVVGIRVRYLEAEVLPVHTGDTLVLATDGIRSGFAGRVARALPAQKVAEQILLHHSKGTDDALVLVARYRGEDA